MTPLKTAAGMNIDTARVEQLTRESIDLLKDLVSTPSLSREEGNAAAILRGFLQRHDLNYEEKLNNTWCFNRHFDAEKKTILLNSHIDTVKPVDGWMHDPYAAIDAENGRITGLGSNDATASLVSLLAAFRYFSETRGLPYNLCFAGTAEEEISGKNGIACLDEVLKIIDFGIIGEPTGMEVGIAERGLMVIDGIVTGKTGHAARNEGINALYLAMEDINWIRNHSFEKEDELLGRIKMTVTMIEAGYQHNIIPDRCQYVIDVRTVDTYSYEEILHTIDEHTHAEIRPRSTRLKPSSISPDHVLVEAAVALDMKRFGSTTLSDQSLLDIPTVKMGPGLSERSHTAGEFILTSEIESGIMTYIHFLGQLFQ
jgi:acetylornithine deacetylase